MKKSAIALAVAAALAASAAAQAETTFYGSFRLSLGYENPNGSEFDSNWNVFNHSSRWGVKGSEDLGNGMSAIYQLETKINADDINPDGKGTDRAFDGRLAWVGLQGGWGAAKIGSQWSPYYNVAGRTDIFNSIGYNFYQGPFRLNDALVYETPDFAGFKGEVMLNMDGLEGKSNLDQWNIGINGEWGPAGFGFAYLDDRRDFDDLPLGLFEKHNIWIITGSVDFAGFSLAAHYEDYDDKGDDGFNNDSKDYLITGQYAFGNNLVKLAWGQQDPKVGDKRDEWGIGFQHNMSKRTRVWAEYNDLKKRKIEGVKIPNTGGGALRLGIRHDF